MYLCICVSVLCTCVFVVLSLCIYVSCCVCICCFGFCACVYVWCTFLHTKVICTHLLVYTHTLSHSHPPLPLQLFVQFAPYDVDPKAGNWADPAFKKAFVHRVFSVIDQYAPGFSDSVIDYDAVRTPTHIHTHAKTKKTNTHTYTHTISITFNLTLRTPHNTHHTLHTTQLSPLDLERIFGLHKGNIFHGAMGIHQLGYARPSFGWSNHRTPVKGECCCTATQTNARHHTLYHYTPWYDLVPVPHCTTTHYTP